MIILSQKDRGQHRLYWKRIAQVYFPNTAPIFPPNRMCPQHPQNIVLSGEVKGVKKCGSDHLNTCFKLSSKLDQPEASAHLQNNVISNHTWWPNYSLRTQKMFLIIILYNKEKSASVHSAPLPPSEKQVKRGKGSWNHRHLGHWFRCLHKYSPVTHPVGFKEEQIYK